MSIKCSSGNEIDRYGRIVPNTLGKFKFDDKIDIHRFDHTKLTL